MDEIPLRDRFGAWCDILGATHLAFAMDPSPHGRGGFGAEIREHGLGTMSLLETAVQPHRGRRTRRQVSANTRDVIGLHFVQTGRQAVDLRGRRVVLGPGDGMIWDGSATGEYEILEPLKKTTLIVPRAVAASVLPSYRNSFVQVLPGDHQPTRFLIRMLALLCDQLPVLDDGARQASALLVSELLKPLGELRGDVTAKPPRVSKPDLRERVLDHIERNLADPGDHRRGARRFGSHGVFGDGRAWGVPGPVHPGPAPCALLRRAPFRYGLRASHRTPQRLR